jgi:alanine racemase
MAIHIDTGMNRLGLNPAQALPLAARLNLSGHGIKLVMSHLACAEMPNHALNAKQINEFREVAHQFPGVTSSLANSSGIFLGQSAHFDLTRPGAALYGVNPTPEQPNPMKGVVTLQARIAQIRDIERGASVGYGATWTARKPTRLAIVAAGYADGYMRAASAADGLRGADVMVAGVKCPLAGRISMDLIAVDITDVPAGKIHRGDFVTLIGDGLGVDDLAHPFGTIGYEVLTALGARYSRVYRGGPDASAPPLPSQQIERDGQARPFLHLPELRRGVQPLAGQMRILRRVEYAGGRRRRRARRPRRIARQTQGPIVSAGIAHGGKSGCAAPCLRHAGA